MIHIAIAPQKLAPVALEEDNLSSKTRSLAIIFIVGIARKRNPENSEIKVTNITQLSSLVTK